MLKTLLLALCVCLCLHPTQTASSSTTSEQVQSEAPLPAPDTAVPSGSSPFDSFLTRQITATPRMFAMLLKDAIASKDLHYFVFMLSLSMKELSPEQRYFLPGSAINKTEWKILKPLWTLIKRLYPSNTFDVCSLVVRTSGQYSNIKIYAQRAGSYLTKILDKLVENGAEDRYVTAATKQRNLAAEISYMCIDADNTLNKIYARLESGGTLSSEDADALGFCGQYVFALKERARGLEHRFATEYKACLAKKDPSVDCERRILDLYGFKEAITLPIREKIYAESPFLSSTRWQKLYSDHCPAPKKKLTLKEEMKLHAKETAAFLEGRRERPAVRVQVATERQKITEGDLED